ncbi:MAG TPA: helix-turn-helix domain-containing protein [Bacteroidales bacterium]|nr:helix-turn-helix domain-containing protein [Bacteroidales bacterium]
MQNILIQINRTDLKDLVTSAISDYFANNGHPAAKETILMTIAEAASFLNCAIPTIYAKVSKRQIPFHKQGKRLYFNKKELIDWIQQPK